MYLARLSSVVRSLRFRLMLWNAFVVVATGAVLLVSVREGVRRALLNELDTALRRDVEQILEFASKPPVASLSDLRGELDRMAFGHREQRWFGQVYDRAGKLIWSTSSTPAELRVRLDLRPPLPFSMVRSRLPAPIYEGASIVVGASQASVERDVARIDQQVAIASAVVLLFAPIGGYLLAVRATEPVSQMIAVTESLRPQKLEERLPVRGTGDELDRLAATVNQMLDRINQYIRHGQEGLANAAHELRTPLAALRSTLEVALDTDTYSEDRNELIVDVIEECDALETLVNQLLMIAEIDVDRLGGTFERVRLDELAQKTIEFFDAVAEDRAVTLIYDARDAVWINGNRHHLRQLLFNLVDNAIKFTAMRFQHPDGSEPASSYASSFDETSTDPSRGGRVHIELTAYPTNGLAHLTITDNGIGIAPEHIDRLFERFYRGHQSRDRIAKSSGTGLGLSICQAIVHSHGGTIEVQSAQLDYTKFIVTFPLAKEVAHDPTNGRKA